MHLPQGNATPNLLWQCGPVAGRTACGPQTEFLKHSDFLSIDLMLCVCYTR